MSKTLVIANAFSLNMFPSWRLDIDKEDGTEIVTPLIISTVSDPTSWLKDAKTRHGTAAVFSTLLGREVPAYSETFILGYDDEVLVGEYSGPRLEEGVTTLPPGSKVVWLSVTIG